MRQNSSQSEGFNLFREPENSNFEFKVKRGVEVISNTGSNLINFKSFMRLKLENLIRFSLFHTTFVVYSNHDDYFLLYCILNRHYPPFSFMKDCIFFLILTMIYFLGRNIRVKNFVSSFKSYRNLLESSRSLRLETRRLGTK